MSSRRQLDKIETQEQVTLRNLWDSRKAELNLTQADAAKKMGFTNQTAISQYLNGNIPLNMETVAKFASLLGVSVKDISPRFAQMLPTPSRVIAIKIKDVDALKFVNVNNNSLAPHAIAGDMLAVDTSDFSTGEIPYPCGKVVAVFRTAK